MSSRESSEHPSLDARPDRVANASWVARARMRNDVVCLVVAFVVVAVGFAFPTRSIAIDVPPPAIDLFLQTSGPSAGLNIGDYYTTPVAGGGGGTDHLFVVTVPTGWPAGTPVTVALYDPESFEDGTATSPSALDEVRGTANDQTVFELRDPTGTVLQTTTFTTSATNGQWYELYTFDPGVSGTGDYELHVSTGDGGVGLPDANDDDNSWRLRATSDPDCVAGNTGICTSAQLDNGNGSDNIDGLPGTGDELIVGIERGSFQHAGTGTVCNTYYFHIGATTPLDGPNGGFLAHNFDLDNSGSVTYTDPDGATYAGTVSGNRVWNNSSTSTRGGDELPAVSGWWSTEVCLNSGNQYVFEGPQTRPVYLETKPPVPEIVLAKSDGLTEVELGDTVTYTIDFSNPSDLGTDPGQALSLQIVDEIPTGTTYVATSCSIAAPFTGTCSYDSLADELTFVVNEPVVPGSTGQVAFSVTVDGDATAPISNTAIAAFEDGLANVYVSTSNTDTDTIDFLPVLQVSKVGSPDPASVGQTVTYTYTVSHTAGSDGSSVSNVVVADSRGLTLTFTGGDTNANTYLDGGESWTWSATETVSVSTPDPLVNTVTVDGDDRNGTPLTQATTSESVDIEFAPVLAIDKTGPASALAGTSVTYDVSVTHDATSDRSPISGVVVSDPFGTVSFGGGDTNANTELDFGETWTYTVVGTLPASPDPYTNTASAQGSDADGDTVGPVSDDHDIDVIQPATISDLAFHDVDGDGIYTDGTDQPLAGVIVNLYDATGTVLLDTDTTLAGGLYSFTGLPPDTYVVEFVAPTGYLTTSTDQGADDTIDSDADPAGATSGRATVTVGDSEVDDTVDAGFYAPGSVGDFVYLDVDGDGAYLGGTDVPLDGVTVTLIGTDGAGNAVSLSTTTGPAGAYDFDDLAPGAYTVAIVEPVGTTATDDRDGLADGTTDIAMTSGADVVDADFGVTGTGAIGDRVFEDVDNNGVYDAGIDMPLSGVTVTATWFGIDGIEGTSDDVVFSTTSAAGGTYSLTNLPAGGYTVDADESTTGLTGATASTPDPATVTLAAGGVDNDVDFGYYETATISDFVWDDLNGSGIQGAGEPGIENVTVTLTGPGADGILGTADDTTTVTTTDVDGRYAFAGLTPGEYSLEFDPSTAAGTYVFTQQDRGANDAVDSDVDAAGTVTVTVLSGVVDDTVDAGLYQPISISDSVWVDANGNGLRDGTETGLNGVAVELLDGAGGVLATTTTAGGGLYSFDDLAPGTYEVHFIAPAGYDFTAADEGSDDTLDSDADPLTGETGAVVYQSGDSTADIDAGVYQPISIGDFVWNDLDGDGVQDPGEPGIVNATVTATYYGPDGLVGTADDTTIIAATNGSGVYGISGAPGTYDVAVTAPAGAVATTATSATTTLTSGGSDLTVDAGYYYPMVVGDFVWVDLDGDGVQDSAEPGLAGVTVTLTGIDGLGNVVDLSTVTAADGSYGFTNLPPGSYTLTVDGTGFTFTTRDSGAATEATDSDVDAGGAVAIITTSGTNDLDVDAGVLPATIGDRVWIDTDGNGLQDGAEPPLPSVTVNLVGPGPDATFGTADDVVVDTDVSDAAGTYELVAAPGDYVVEFLAPFAYLGTEVNAGADDIDSDADRTTGRTEVVTIVDATDSTTAVDAGFYRVATISDFVWVDTDGDGVQDAAEPGLDGVSVTLTGSDGAGNPVSLGTTTGGGGRYSFDVPPGTYTLGFDLATAGGGYVLTAPNVGDDALDSDAGTEGSTSGSTGPVTVVSGAADSSVDAGAYVVATVTGTVLEDALAEGSQDAADSALVGVTVNLLDDVGNVVATTVTDGSGDYRFDPAPGSYSVQVIAPADGTFSPPDAAADAVDSDVDAAGETTQFTLTSGGTTDQDALIWFPAEISDLVWVDLDQNGVQDGGEPGHAGVVVNLIDDLGATIETTTTAADGSYSFSASPGTYSIEVLLPAASTFTVADAGVDDTVDSDITVVVANVGETAQFTVVSSEVNTTLDAGVLPALLSNFVWDDVDGDGVQDGGEPGIVGVTVNLWADTTGDGTPDTIVATDITGGSGDYELAAAPGVYLVEFDFSTTGSPYLISPQDQGADDTIDSDADPSTGRTAIFAVTDGTPDDTLDAGAALGATLSDFVWDDLDGNGIQDAGEPGLVGVAVTLVSDPGTDGVFGTADDVVVASDVTAAGGLYSLTARPGDYTVVFAAPAGLQFSPADQGGDDTLDSDPVPAVDPSVATVAVSIGSGSTDDTIDAGLFTPATVADFVWRDLDGNGLQDDGPTGIGNVTVTLVSDVGTDGVFGTIDDVVVDTVTTAADGSYLLTADPGSYTVVFDLSTAAGALVFTAADVGADDSIDSDVAPTADPQIGTVSVTLRSGDADTTVDAGAYVAATISDLVYHDVDGDGGFTPGTDIPLADVALTLYDVTGATVLDSTVTAADGTYSFTTDPATYQVVVTTASLPAGMTITDDPDGGTPDVAVVTVASGELNDTTDFGYTGTGSIGDVVFEDVDNDGVYTGGVDIPLDGVVVTAVWEGPDGVAGTADDVVYSTVTAGGGLYTIGLLPARDYVVDADESTTGLSAPVSSTGDPQSTNLDPAEIDDTVDFGWYRPATIVGEVFSDVGRDGVSTGDPRVDGLPVELWEDTTGNGTADTLVASTTTLADGSYTFSGVPPGDYAVIVDGTGFAFTTRNAGADDTIDSDVDAGGVSGLFSVRSDDTVDGPDAGLLPAPLGDRIWDDLDGDGIQDPGEPGLGGVTVNLYDSADLATPVDSTTSDGLGAYGFDVAPGDYVIEVIAPVGARLTVAGQGGDPALDSDVDEVTGRTAPISVIDGVGTDVIDAGLVTPASAGDLVYEDLDGDGLRDPGEVGLAGIDVRLIDAGPDGVFGTPDDVVLDTQTTDGAGAYRFTGLDPGTYRIAVDPASVTAAHPGYTGTTANPITVVVSSGDAVTTADFGFVPPSALTVTKEPATQDVVSGGDATFTVTVTNSGGTELTDVAITDLLAACDTTTIASLAAEASTVISCMTPTVTTSFTNTVDVSADSPAGTLNASDTAEVVVLTSSVAVTKNPSTQNVVSGGDATFTVTVTNDGETDLVDIAISDPLATCGVTAIASLPVGDSATATCTTSGVTSDFTNTVDVTGVDPVGAIVGSSDAADVVVVTPAVTVTKDPATQDVPLNGEATFTVTIENTGETALTNLVIDDPLASCDITSIGSLAVGESRSATCTSTGVTADFTNTVNVTADDPIGNTLSVSDTADVDVLLPGVSITKGPATQFVVLGDAVTFDIAVTNTGALDLGSVTVSDPLAPTCDRTFAVLAVGASQTYACTQVPVVSDYVNEASVEATDTAGNIVGDSDTAVVDVVDPSIEIDKSPDLTIARTGDTITFTIDVTNTGDVALTNVVVSDPLTATCDNAFASIAAGATETYTCATAATTDFTNTATVTADEPAGGAVSAADTADVDVIAPAIGVTKSPANQTVIVNGTAVFGISVTNLGDAALTNVVVSDPLAPDCDTGFASLAVGETRTHLCGLTPVTADFTNVVTVSADDPSGGQVSAADTAEVAVVAGALDIQKSPNLQFVVDGDAATFDITVTNGGTIELFDVAVSDPEAPDCANDIGALPAGSSVTYSCTLAAVGADFTNTATVSAVDAVGNPLTDVDTAVVDVIVPAISVSKTPDVQTVVAGGDAAFTISVTNTGDVDLTDVAVTDVVVPACAATIAALPVGTTVSNTCTSPGVTADFTNTVDVVADEPSGGTVTSSDTADVQVLEPRIEIQKSPDYQITGLGGSADFTITVTNSGETDLTDVVVTDPLVPDCDNTIPILAVGATVSYACADSGIGADYTNTAGVTAADPMLNPVSDFDTADVDLIDPGLAVSKTPGLQTLLSGATADFSIEVTNTGDIDLANVVVSDPNAPGCDASFPALAVGATETVLCSVVGVTVDFVNTATVTAPNPLGGTIVVNDTATVDVVAPGVSIEKTPDTQQVVVGTDATFTITVTNSGTEALVAVVVADPSAPVCDNPIGPLPVGSSVSYDCTVIGVTGDFTNIALVDAVDGLGNPVSDSDDAAVDAIAPSIAISKTPDLQTVVLGGTASFTIEVTNTGDVPLIGVTVVDPLAPDCDITIAALAPGETATYTCSQPNVTSGFTDIADVSATDPLGNVVTASDSGGVVVLVPAIEIQKTPDLQQVTTGDTAPFTITVTNSGQTALTNVVVSDPQVPTCARIISSLAIGASTSYTCAGVVTADFTNIASVTADDPLGNPWTDSDTADVDAVAPSLFVTKSPDVQSVPLGSVATFTIEVTNDGDVDLTDVTVTDATTPTCANTLLLLPAGATWTYTCSATVTDDFTNTASVSGTDPNGVTIDGGTDVADVTVLRPSVLVEKTPDAQAVGIGQDATFTITITNIGDVGLDTIVVVDAAVPACDTTVGPLAPGGSATYTCSAVDVLAGFTNEVDVTATDGNGNITTTSDRADVIVLPASIEIAKVADSPTVVDGGDITYTVTVANTSPADLLAVAVTDPTLPACDNVYPSLAAGAVESYTCTLTAVDAAASDPVVNTIGVMADDEAGNVVTDTASATVDVLVPSISLFKTAVVADIVEGDDATFTITVINVGDVPLTAVDVSDAAYPECDASYAALAIREVRSHLCTIVGPTGDVANTADVTAVDPIGGVVGDTASATVMMTKTGDLTGLVFRDEDGDGVFEPADGDTPIVDVDVVLTAADGGTTIVSTDAAGMYAATLPTGSYTVDVDETDIDFPTGYPTDTTGADGQRVVVLDDAPTTAAPIGFGPPRFGSLRGTVWHDIDADGIVDPDETDLTGVRVTVAGPGPDGVFGTADDTDHGAQISGPFVFDRLLPGLYRVAVDASTLPIDTQTPTFDRDGGFDASAIVAVISAAVTENVDFGFVDLVPVAVPDEATTDEGVPVVIAVLDNDSDPDGGVVTLRSVVQPFNGVVTINTDGTVTYAPAAGFDGVDVFTYTICDPAGECATAAVTVTVRNTNEPPVLTATVLTVRPDMPLPSLALFDPDGGPIVVTLVDGTLPTGLTLNADGSFTGTATVAGSFTFTVRLCDELGACSNVTVTLQVDQPGTVAATGASSRLLAQVAAMLVALGAGLVLVAHRRRRFVWSASTVATGADGEVAR